MPNCPGFQGYVRAASLSNCVGSVALTADGERVPIDEISPGDEVVATDPQTDERVTRTVVGSWSHVDQTVTSSINDHDVVTTVDHRFWSQSVGAFVPAGDLEVGDKVVEDHGRVHTYHVDDTDTVVHNTCLVQYDPFFALGGLVSNGDAGASELDAFGAAQGWVRSRSPLGPIRYIDENGVRRIEIKRGIPRVRRRIPAREYVLCFRSTYRCAGVPGCARGSGEPRASCLGLPVNVNRTAISFYDEWPGFRGGLLRGQLGLGG